MNKFKKMATTAVATVMAGTMLGSVAFMAACKPDNSDKGGNTNGNLKVNTDANGKLTYADGTVVNFNVGNQNSKAQGISYTNSDLSGSTYMIDGKSYSSGNLKPAWAAMASQLKIDAKDVFTNVSSDKQITNAVTEKTLSRYDIITGSLSAINQNTSNFVNLADWLDYMPNYKAFLETNAVTKYSLTGDTNGGMYAAPYFDGNNDIEYYNTIRKDWVEKILDNELNSEKFKTFAAQAAEKDSYKDGSDTKQHGSIVGTQSAVKAYMGTKAEDSYTVESAAEDGTKIFIRLDYGKALAAAKDGNSALGQAINAAAGKAYDGDSGNIVDMQNFAINEKQGDVTGDKLAKIVSEYIKVAYLKVASATATDGTPAYTKASDVFNSVSAAWDVDLLAATLRAIICNNGYLDGDTGALYGIVARQATSQRRVMLLTMASELYGVRGLGSRLEYIYIDNNGELRDSRQNADSYNALNNFSAFAKEGILYTGEEGADGFNSWRNEKSNVLGAMSYDYIQTQTKNAVTGASQNAAPGYNYAPILTPVSRWDVNDDGTHETVMRFTESWRSVKNTGFCVPVEAVSNNPDKFSAVLTFIDFLFSEDGQILMTYGTPSSTDSYDKTAGTSSDNGFWYAKESSLKLEDVATLKTAAYGNVPAQYEVKPEYKTGAGGVFVYNGKVYEGTEYGGRIVPQITKANYAFFSGNEIKVKGSDNQEHPIKQNTGNLTINQVGSYTNYARYVLGTTLPIGNKNQGFEFQCTAECGRNGASIVDKAITAGVIKHVVVDPKDAASPWYFISPTAYPLTANQQTTLKNDEQTKVGQYFRSSSTKGEGMNVYLEVMYYGFGTQKWLGSDVYILGEQGNGGLKANGEEYVNWLNGAGMNVRVNIYKAAWATLKTTYNIFN